MHVVRPGSTPIQPSAPKNVCQRVPGSLVHRLVSSRHRGALRDVRTVVVVCVYMAAILCGVPRGAGAAVDQYIGKPIASVDLTIEGRPTTDAAVLGVLETRVGQPLSVAAVRESIAHLFSLGRFDDVRVDASEVVGGRVALRYDLSPLHPISTIKFAGRLDAPGVDTAQMRQAVVTRYGASPPFGRTSELTQIVTDVLHEHGYLHPEVKPQVEFTHAPDRATLVFTIEPGPRAVISSIDIVAPPTVSRPALLEHLGLAVGAVYRPDALNTRIERYVAEQRKAGYYESKVTATPTADADARTVDLTLRVVPGAHVRVVFTGDPLPSDRRTDLVPIEREGSVDEDLLEDSTNRIEDYLRAQGYRDAKAPHRREQQDGELAIAFDVTKGAEYRVGQIDVSGNASVPPSDFEPLLRLRVGQPFAETTLDTDVAMLEGLYRRRGFASARVQPGVESQGAQSGQPFVPLLVRIVINEGPRTMVESVRIEGNTSISEATLKGGLGLQPEQPYSGTQMVIDRDSIQLQYLNLGFPNATVSASPNFSADRIRADPMFEIHEGVRVYVEHVLIVGNVRTSSNTILRELQLKPGDPLSAAARVESQRRLATLGLFRRIQISELRHGDEATRDLVVLVEEAPPNTIGFGGGFEVRLQPVRTAENPDFATERLEFAPRGSFEIGRRNFLGKNRTANLFTSASLYLRDAETVELTPSSGLLDKFAFAEYRIVGQVQEPRLFETNADLLVTGALEQQIRSSFNFSRRGASAAIGRSLTREVKVSGSYQIQRIKLFDVKSEDTRLIDQLFPQVRLASFSGSVTRDGRDNLTEPGSGQYLSVSGQLAAQRIGSEVGFAKTFVTAQSFRTLPGGNRFVLAGQARLGLANGFGRTVQVEGPNGEVEFEVIDDLPASERFYGGGDTTVRGFALDTLGTPETIDEDGFPLGGNAIVIFNAELRALVRGPISAVGFLDIGNVFRRASGVRLGDLRSAVGFGLRYRSPVGPIRVDLGFKIHPEVVAGRRERPTALHITLGQAF
jgi:outer membrane protein insertion porin family